MKYIKKFRNHTEYEEAISQNLILPNVSLCAQEKEVHYNPYVPRYAGFCKLTLNDGSTVELEGSGELTSAMTSNYKSTLVSAEIGKLCTSIGEAAFRGYSRLTSITIPNSVTSIDQNAFSSCNSLTSVTIPNSVTSFGNGTFSYCTGLTSVTIGNSVTSIGNYAFNSCSSLTSVTIGNSVTRIGNNAFYNCSGLTSVTIPNSVTNINNSAFYNCSGLTSVTVNATTPPTLGTNVFNGNSSSRVIYVPSESVNAYKSATNWSEYADSIQTIQ